MKKKTVCVVGLGYIGLPTAAILANNGFNVNGIDINKNVVNTINQGNIHIVEPKLKKYVQLAVKKKKLKAFTKIKESNIYIICVPTPIKKKNNIYSPDTTFVTKAIRNIVPFIKSGDMIILESTSPVGTTEKIRNIIANNNINIKDIHIAYCPERVLPGKIIKELINNDRIIGGLNFESAKKIANFYRLFVKGKVFETDMKTAEMCKLTENSYRDLNIAFANELSIICEKQGINVWDLIKFTNKHPRVNILQPGIGVGGHCLAVDPWFIISKDKKNTKLIRTAREVNSYKSQWIFKKIKKLADDYYKKNRSKPKIVCFGITYKPDIDDLRESKSLEVVEKLISEKYQVLVVEPNIKSYKNLTFVKIHEGLNNGNIFCILVKHKEFLLPQIIKNLKKYEALDCCGLLN